MQYYDCSLPVNEKTVSWPTDPKILIRDFKSLDEGGTSGVKELIMGTHSGTHIDAPAHYFKDGKTVEQIDPGILNGTVRVLELDGHEEIGRHELEQAGLRGAGNVFFKTGNSKLYSSGIFQKNYAHLILSGAEYLIEQGVRLAGIDYLSIEKYHGDGSVHRLLLQNEVVIIESLYLKEVPAGVYEMICLPLALTGTDGAPARVLLRSTD